ncbi:MAG: ABC transporter ATP-binding protein, partial [Actinobacteria bacterium]|nr:ABC transporter ATP-binding protein [Actinomycetota bacterium]
MEEFAIRAERLEKVFGEGDVQVRAVQGVDLEVRRGEVVLIMGPSGSGKTTLLSMLGAMLRPTSGRISVDGVDLVALPESRLPEFRSRRFGFVFQDFNLLSALSAVENVEFALNLAGASGTRSRERAERLLRDFGLRERLHFRPEKLSGGEKQRVAIARALANEPAVILADEPTANLDSKIGHEIARL